MICNERHSLKISDCEFFKADYGSSTTYYYLNIKYTSRFQF